MSSSWIVVISTLAGVLVGFLLTFVRDRIEANSERRRLAVALLAEARALFERYEDVFGVYIGQLEQGQVIQKFGGGFTGAFRQDFFAVFDRNTERLGLFKSADVETIVRSYVMAKAHIETLNYTLTQLDEIGRAAILAGPAGETVATKQAHEVLEQLTPILRQESAEIGAAAQQVLAILAGYAGRQSRKAT